jgi:hypothetical protein
MNSQELQVNVVPFRTQSPTPPCYGIVDGTDVFALFCHDPYFIARYAGAGAMGIK